MNALDTMRALATSGEVIQVPAGSMVFKAGESGDCMFGLLEGTVDLTWNGEPAIDEEGKFDMDGLFLASQDDDDNELEVNEHW